MKKELLHCRQYKSALSTKVDADGKEIGSSASKAKHAYRAIDMSNVPSEILSSHVNYFHEPLYCAERCWAASMAVKAEGMNGRSSGGGGALGGGGGNPRENWSPGKIRAYSIKRLRKAAKFATLLETLAMSTKSMPSDDKDESEENNNASMEESKPPVDEHTQMEARAYASWMRGNLALEQNQWQTACNEYQTAMTLCESLASDSTKKEEDGANNDDDGNANLQQLELFDFFTTRAQNVVAPLLRYCHYELQVCEPFLFTCCIVIYATTVSHELCLDNHLFKQRA